jgi:hypothetical protein
MTLAERETRDNKKEREGGVVVEKTGCKTKSSP